MYLVDLLSSYDDVLSEELKWEPMSTNGPLRLHLKRGGRPYRTAIARRFEEQEVKTLEELK